MANKAATTGTPDGTLIAPQNKVLGAIAMFISATGMGLVGTLGRLSTPVDEAGQRYVIGDFLAMGRMTMGALGMLLIIMMVRKMTKLRKTKISFSVFAGGFCIGASLALYVSSTLMTTIANAVFLIYVGPLISAILALVFLKERIDLKHGIFLTLVFIGMIMTVGLINYAPGEGISFGLELGANPDFPKKTIGDIFGLASGFFYGAALFFYRYRGDIDSEVRGFYNFLFGIVGAAVIMVFRMIVLDPTNPIEVMQPTNWAWAFVLFLVCGFIAIGFLVVAGKNLLAVELSTIAYWECAVALLFGLFFWDEPITLIGGIGGVLIIIGGMGPVFLIKKEREQQIESGELSVTEGGFFPSQIEEYEEKDY